MSDISQITKISILLLILFLCSQSENPVDKQVNMKSYQYSYAVSRTSRNPDEKTAWNNKIWKNTDALSLDNYMGTKPVHFPDTRVKMLYDDERIYIFFSVSDRYVKAVENKINGKVWQDSCVEFFFSPGPETERGYFNFEVNCKGVFLFQYHVAGKSGFVHADDYKKIKIAHSLKRNAEQEIDEDLKWQISYSIPFSILENYMKVEKPGSGVSWRANFYKCADNTSHPHWLTWAFVDYPRPKFHLPEFFGWLNFE